MKKIGKHVVGFLQNLFVNYGVMLAFKPKTSSFSESIEVGAWLGLYNNDPKNTPQVIKEWFLKKHFTVMERPSQSPDHRGDLKVRMVQGQPQNITAPEEKCIQE